MPLDLLRRSADAAFTSGDGQAGETLLNRAVQHVEAGDEEGTGPLDRARVIGEQARRLITRGDPGQAEQLLRDAYQLFTAAGSEDEAATAMGSIADIAYRRGDYDEALRIYREVQLPVYERLGDTRSAAVTWGRIADIAYQRGDYDEALRIRREIQLPVYERLGDTRSAAVTWGKIADIAYRRGDYDEALRIRREVQLPVYERLGDTRSAAVTWGSIADIAYQRGDYDEALRIRREVQLPVYERLGDTRETAITWGQHRRHPLPAGRLRRGTAHPPRGAAAGLERLGDTRETAITWGKIADIAYRRGDYDEALRIRREIELPVYERLGDTRSTAITWGKIADIAYQRGDYDEAAELQRKRLEVKQAARRPRRDRRRQLGSGPDRLRTRGLPVSPAPADRVVPDLRPAATTRRDRRRGLELGQLLMAAGQADQARHVLGEVWPPPPRSAGPAWPSRSASCWSSGHNKRGDMIIQLESAAAGDVEAARRSLEAMAHGWGQEIAEAPRGGGGSHPSPWGRQGRRSGGAGIPGAVDPFGCAGRAGSGRPHP